MKLLWVVSGVLALALLTGMGASSSPVEKAIKSSPFSFYHFRAAAWWGRPVTISTRSVQVTGDTATAVVVASSHGKTIASQSLSLQRTKGHWALLTSLVGEPFGTISGATATRKPTASETAAISAASFKQLKNEQDCVHLVIKVSKVDPGFALVGLTFFGPRKVQCESNGVFLFARSASGVWAYHGGGSDPFPCESAPPGVIRSLFGTCFIVAD